MWELGEPMSAEMEEAGHARRPGISRRILLAGGGLSVGATLLSAAPALAAVSFDVRAVLLPFKDQLFALNATARILQWNATMELLEEYFRRDRSMQDGDAADLKTVSSYLLRNLQPYIGMLRRMNDIALEHESEIQQASLQTIQQSPLSAELHERATTAFQRKTIAERLRMANDTIPANVDGFKFQESVTELAEGKGIAVSKDPDEQKAWLEQKKAWYCATLNSMLAGAVASGQLYLVSSIVVRLDMFSCLDE